MENNTVSLTLAEIADWQLSPRNTMASNATWAKIPSFQRGLVWNPAQIEVLWDSLMRGIPIGALSLLPKNGNSKYGRGDEDEEEDYGESYWLVDGQQRANAIALGYKPFPTSDNNENILWLDLLPDRSKRTRRQFFFYLTTPGRPWGYRAVESDDEKSREQVSINDYRRVLGEIGWTRERGSKPQTSLLWPIKANLPIPFSPIRDLYASQQHLGLTNINDLVKNSTAAWATHFQCLIEDYQANQSFDVRIKGELEKIAKGLERIKRTKTIGLVVPDCLSGDENDENETDDNSNIAVYFSRLNKGGSTPENEDLDYSILKSVVPQLHVIDEFAKQLMHPPRLANIAVLTFLSLEKWKNSLSRADIFRLQNNAEFSGFIGTINNSTFKNAVDVVFGWLKFNPNNNFGLPPVVCSSIAKNSPRLFRFLILFALLQKGKDHCVPQTTIIAFVTILNWFGNDETLNFQLLYKQLKEKQVQDYDLILSKWIGIQIECGVLAMPPHLSVFEQLHTSSKSNDVEKLKKAWNPTGYSEGLEKVWGWTTSSGRCFLLYACRKFLEENFPGYDPSLAVWNEDNRPWDYDHIIPQAWLQQGRGKPQGPYHEVVEKFLMSIGNIAPVPFSINRSKHDDPPGEYLEKDNELVFVDFRGSDAEEPAFVRKKPAKKLENLKETACSFACMTTTRWINLFKEWKKLPIDDLLSNSVDDIRMENIKEIQRCFTENKLFPETVYLWKDGKQYKVNEKLDYIRPWIACGVPVKFSRQDGSKESCFLSVCFQKVEDKTTHNLKEMFEVGLRRHPTSSTPFMDGEWWAGGHSNYKQTYSLNEAKAFLYQLLDLSDIEFDGEGLQETT